MRVRFRSRACRKAMRAGEHVRHVRCRKTDCGCECHGDNGVYAYICTRADLAGLT